MCALGGIMRINLLSTILLFTCVLTSHGFEVTIYPGGTYEQRWDDIAGRSSHAGSSHFGTGFVVGVGAVVAIVALAKKEWVTRHIICPVQKFCGQAKIVFKDACLRAAKPCALCLSQVAEYIERLAKTYEMSSDAVQPGHLPMPSAPPLPSYLQVETNNNRFDRTDSLRQDFGESSGYMRHGLYE